MGAHARRSPSRWDLYTSCPGACNAEVEYPNETSTSAAFGTQCHALLEVCIEQRWWISGHVVAVLVDGAEVPITNEHSALVDKALRYIKSRKAELGGESVTIRAEIRADAGRLIGRTDVAGTADVLLFSFNQPGGDTVEIIDAKFGVGYVPATTRQMVAYAGGVVDQYTRNFAVVRRTIIQPRFEHPDDPVPGVRWVETTRPELLQELGECGRLLGLTDAGDAPRIPGDHCDSKFCRARRACAARLNALVGASEPEFREVLVSPPTDLVPAVEHLNVVVPAQLDIAQLRALYENGARVREFIDALGEELRIRVERGDPDTGYKMVHGRSNRGWAGDEATVVKKLRGMGLKSENIYDQKLRGPAQIEKHPIITGASTRRANSFAAMIRKPEGKPTMVPESDPRPAIKNDLAEGLIRTLEAETAEAIAPATLTAAIVLPNIDIGEL